MHPDLLKILSHQDHPIDNEQLVQYLTGQLTAEESHTLESQLSEAGFDQDALEGLMLMNDKKKLSGVQMELNMFLKEKLNQTKKKKKRQALLSLPSLLIITGGLIILIIVAWYFIYYLGGK
jgi:CHASE3 domain sensor protein